MQLSIQGWKNFKDHLETNGRSGQNVPTHTRSKTR